MDTDSKHSSFLACDLDLCTIILVLHDKGVKRLFYERVSSHSYRPRASPEFSACPDLFGNLCTLHDYGREQAQAHHAVQGTAGDLAWLMEQSCL